MKLLERSQASNAVIKINEREEPGEGASAEHASSGHRLQGTSGERAEESTPSKKTTFRSSLVQQLNTTLKLRKYYCWSAVWSCKCPPSLE